MGNKLVRIRRIAQLIEKIRDINYYCRSNRKASLTRYVEREELAKALTNRLIIICAEMPL